MKIPISLCLTIAMSILMGCSGNTNGMNEPSIGNSSTDTPTSPIQIDPSLSGNNTQALNNAIIDRRWVLSKVIYNNGTEQQHTNVEGYRFELEFTKLTDNAYQITGVNLCNSFQGSYLLESNVLTLSDLSSTDAVCVLSGAGVAPLFAKMLSPDNNSSMLSVNASQMIITLSSNEQLIFTESETGYTGNLVDFELIATGDLAFTEDLTYNHPRYLVFNSNQALNQHYFNALIDTSCTGCGYESFDIDFTRHTVVLVADEIHPSGGFSIYAESISKMGPQIQVNVVRTVPGENCAVDAAFSGVYQLYKLDGVFENVDFTERFLSGAPCDN